MKAVGKVRMVSFIPTVKRLNHEIHESHEKNNKMCRSIATGLRLNCAEITFSAITKNDKTAVYPGG
jgi:hypothetical protein